MNCLYLGQCGLIHLQLYLINISYIHIQLLAGRVPSSAFTLAGVGQEQQHWGWGRTLIKQWITNVCLHNLQLWLFMPAVRPLLHWTHGHGGVFTWTCRRAWQCGSFVTRGESCVGMPTDQCIPPQQGKYITSTCYHPKMSSVNYRPKGDHLCSPHKNSVTLRDFIDALYFRIITQLRDYCLLPSSPGGCARGGHKESLATFMPQPWSCHPMPATYSASIHLAIRCYQIFCIFSYLNDLKRTFQGLTYMDEFPLILTFL